MTGAASPSSSALVSSVLFSLLSEWVGGEHVGLPPSFFWDGRNTKIDCLLSVCVINGSSLSIPSRPAATPSEAAASKHSALLDSGDIYSDHLLS
ncbi:hypothetical protein PF008_g14578 [Phytophthora fragariae]|uniref:Secreted protein n=1 Tax=Phytophthora fragariae TaxID=53985 RepID=A0A6G0RHH4_9STRA|nr:hypothetical protein PF008_g14578 [Phytophthora fragariae]